MLVTLLFTWAANAATLKTILIIPGAAVDKTPLGEARGGANVNRLGGFFGLIEGAKHESNRHIFEFQRKLP